MKNNKLIINKISRYILSFMSIAFIFPGLTSARPFIVGADISWYLKMRVLERPTGIMVYRRTFCKY